MSIHESPEFGANGEPSTTQDPLVEAWYNTNRLVHGIAAGTVALPKLPRGEVLEDLNPAPVIIGKLSIISDRLTFNRPYGQVLHKDGQPTLRWVKPDPTWRGYDEIGVTHQLAKDIKLGQRPGDPATVDMSNMVTTIWQDNDQGAFRARHRKVELLKAVLEDRPLQLDEETLGLFSLLKKVKTIGAASAGSRATPHTKKWWLGRGTR